ncbi:PKD domain-containing protein [Lentzea kentuckyensis]|uniref:PKD domain-containing protein n=1 Tax=Lentzea kentuckyensis TaxID=360086 RepID=UPI001302740D|nr:PKD domain-containing protein [Lentzea kentuckyensis]
MQCDDGPNSLRAAVSWTDPFDHTHTWSAPPVPVVIENAPQVNVYNSDRYFSPNGDGVEDSQGFSYCLTSAANVDITVQDPAGTVVRTLESAAPHLGTAGCPYSSQIQYAEWDGRSDSGAVVPDGVYTVKIHATNTRGQTGDGSARLGVDTRVPGVLTAPAAGATISGTTTWSFRPTIPEISYVALYCGGRYASNASTLADDGTFVNTFETASCDTGQNELRAAASWQDPFGSWHSWSSPPTAVTVVNPPQINVSGWAQRYFSPNGDLQEDVGSFAYCLVAPATVDTTVVDLAGALVRTLESGVQRRGTLNCQDWNTVEWDGRSDTGSVVPDGEYTVRIHAGNAAGSADATLRTGVLTAAPGTLVAPAANATITGSAEWVFAPEPGYGVHEVYVNCDLGYASARSTAPRADGMFGAQIDVTTCTSGANGLRATAYWTDPLGAFHGWTTATVPVTVSNAPKLTLALYQERYFSPNDDGQEDTTYFSYCNSTAGKVDVTVTGSAGDVVRTIQSGADHPGNATCYYYDYLTWDGRSDTGAVVPDGVYTVRFHVTDSAGRTADATIRSGVDSRVPGQVIAPVPGATLAGLATLAVQPVSGLALYQVDMCFRSGRCATVYGASPDGVWRTSVFTGTLPSGVNSLRPSFYWIDAFGYGHGWSAPEFPVVIDNLSVPLSVTATPATGAAPLDTALSVETSEPQGRTLHYTVNFGDGSSTLSGDIATPYQVLTLRHTYANPGVYRAVVSVANSSGASAVRSVDVTVSGGANTAPVPNLAVNAASGVVPHPVRVEIGATDAENDRLTYLLDYGDGSAAATGTLPANPFDHTYERSGTYIVRLAVSDGKLTAARTANVVVGLAEPLSANAGDDQVAVVNTVVHLDGGGSRPSQGIENFRWDFGDGTSATGAAVDHAYNGAGTYNAKLSVTAGGQTKTDEALITVTPVPAEAGLVVTVDDGTTPLPGATLVVVDPAGRRYTAVTDSSGHGRLLGLPDGEYAVYGWRDGFLPTTVTSTVTGGSGTAALHLKAGKVATTELTASPMTYEEIVAAGINPEDPANQNVYEFTVNIGVGPSTATVSGYTSSGGFPLCPKVNGSSVASCSGSASISVGDNQVLVYPNYVGSAPQLVWLVIPGKASWLKEFFSIQLAVTNLADPGFTLDQGVATLALPTGLSLAPTATAQHDTTTMPDIGGGETKSTTWLVRGDVEGFYDLSASYAAVLEPFGATVRIDAATAKSLHVWGASAAEIVVDVENDFWDRHPYRMRVGLKNVADVPIYNASVELLSQGKQHYLYQPREALRQSTAQITAGTTFWTDDYVLAPDISGTVDLSNAFVATASGANGPKASIVTHPPLSTPATTPALQAFRLPQGVGLVWENVPGATSYEVYSTPDRSTDFGGTPLAVVPAPATQVMLPSVTDMSAWYAVSALINGKRTMVHALTTAEAKVDGPSISVELSSQASCNTDIGGKVTFTDIFTDLRSYSVTLDGQTPPLVQNALLSGRTATVSLPALPASKIKETDSELTVEVTDGALTRSRTVTVSKRCNPIKMLVLGDSIGWGQGLLEKDKYWAKVETDVERLTGRPVQHEVVAHSGAVVDDPETFCSGGPVTSAKDTAGEIPSAVPDVLDCQIDQVKNLNADLILVDGCINDVNVVSILTQPWFITEREVREKCAGNVMTMLQRLHADHRNATIVLTGYYPIFTAGSVVNIATFAKTFGLSAGVIAGLATGAEVINSQSFYEMSNAVLRNNVLALSGDGTQPPWLKFVDPALNGISDGLFAPATKQWAGVNDNRFSDRWSACREWNSPGFDRAKCRIASAGHPNVLGAENYREAIVAELGGSIDSWKGPGPITKIGVSLPTTTIPKGDSQPLTVTATYSNGDTRDAASLVKVWSTNNAVASVEPQTMTVKAVSTGNATINAALLTNETINASVNVTVTAAVPKSLAVTPAAPLIAVNKTVPLTATVTMTDGTATVVTPTWTSGNTTIATVSTKGVVKGAAAGTVTITATYRGLTGTTVVTVGSGPPEITGFTPASGPPGTTITIQGSNLLGVNSVTVGGAVASTFTVDSSSRITAVVPAAARTGFVEVKSPLGTAKSKGKFTVR